MRISLAPRTAAIVVAIIAASSSLPAQQVAANTSGEARGAAPAPAATSSTASAVRAVRAPVIDGRDDDVAWHDARVIDQFLEYEPNEGAQTRFRTEVRVMYDDKYLYIVGHMYDPAPDSIVSLLSRRDVRTQSEWLKLVIDSYHDRKTAYQFIVNPAGVKRDYYVSNDGNEDPSWDAIWDVATSIDSTGWIAEFRIPFSQLRFDNSPEKTFGLLMVRDIARTGQRVSWPLYKRNKQGYVSQGGELSGIVGLSQPRRVELAPYVVSKNVTLAQSAPGHYSHPQQVTGGADLKVGLSSKSRSTRRSIRTSGRWRRIPRCST